MSPGSLKQGSQEFLHVSQTVLTRLSGVNGREFLLQIRTFLGAPSLGTAGSDLLVKIRVLRVASASGVPVSAAISESPTSDWG